MESLIIHSSYTDIKVGLIQNAHLIAYQQTSSKLASAQLIPIITTLISETLKNISYIAVNAGPGPFTTLRTSIATANGIAFATNIPLVTLNNLEVLVRSSASPEYSHVFGLLHAFCNDVYYAHFDKNTNKLDMGVCSIEAWIVRFKTFMEQHPYASMRFVGNGYTHHAIRIKQELGALVPDNIIEYASIEQMAAQAIVQWHNKEQITQQIVPLYLKPYVPHS